MKNISIALLITCLGVSTLLSQNLTTDIAGTSISFKIKNFGINVDGAFSDFQINANFDRDTISKSYFSGTAKIKSIETGIKARDKSLQKEEYFHSSEFSELKLSSTSIKNANNDNQYEFIGDLTIKGKTKEITFPFTLEDAENAIILKGDFEINRRDFKVGKSSLILNKKVKVSISYKGLFK